MRTAHWAISLRLGVAASLFAAVMPASATTLADDALETGPEGKTIQVGNSGTTDTRTDGTRRILTITGFGNRPVQITEKSGRTREVPQESISPLPTMETNLPMNDAIVLGDGTGTSGGQTTPSEEFTAKLNESLEKALESQRERQREQAEENQRRLDQVQSDYVRTWLPDLPSSVRARSQRSSTWVVHKDTSPRVAGVVVRPHRWLATR